jgi:hypothetical protein
VAGNPHIALSPPTGTWNENAIRPHTLRFNEHPLPAAASHVCLVCQEPVAGPRWEYRASKKAMFDICEPCMYLPSGFTSGTGVPCRVVMEGDEEEKTAERCMACGLSPDPPFLQSTDRGHGVTICGRCVPNLDAPPDDGPFDPQPASLIRQNGRASQQNKECTVCYDSAANIALVPCGHTVLCNRCASRVSECPVCRAKVQSRLRIFL